jgi:hypothetical protein
MARTFVFSDNMAARVEIRPIDEVEYGTWGAFCIGCNRWLDDPIEFDSTEDAVSAAEVHADACQRCADDTCYAIRPHDPGPRCHRDEG